MAKRGYVLILFCLTAAWVGVLHAQQSRRVIQLSGIVLGTDDRDSLIQLPGVHVYVPKAGRGAVTNALGFFSMPVMVGDSVVISSVGYERQWYIVPNHPSEFLTIIIELVQDITYLSEIEVMPFPTEEVFKEAILALNLPPEKGPIDKKNMSQQLLALMVKTTPMDGPMNQRYYLDQWAAAQGQQYAPITNPYLNVFNWAKFFKSLQQNKKKKN
ncbi:MAG: carboxypeptidase-like regulatory domain-containing protein [Cyclobacteriaceae bacterium]|nr:carboxypeptidase-like regulatory domain-containing protein [Cyclobacteriaceae bacterium]MCX7638673.1 carboxypeptidase-like regulatory domain-containing protein [Cyclobacteriaceae bacterium]MDW8332446.1 carboxypeptidase-like regulatory domain-containing protein [Cyclobacteriaceae bacterium]